MTKLTSEREAIDCAEPVLVELHIGGEHVIEPASALRGAQNTPNGLLPGRFQHPMIPTSPRHQVFVLPR
jgi:hypothetical protein